MRDNWRVDLVEFLLARIADDEGQRVERFRKGGLPTPRELKEAARWEAECDAKRRIVEQAEEHADSAESEGGGVMWIPEPWAGILRLLALPYADHADYRQEWKV